MMKHDPMTGLEGLMFTARRLVDGLYSGLHASPMRGAGIEFQDYRVYTPGDDLRSIDWKLYGRSDRYYVKRFSRDTDLNLHLTIDGSASMNFSSLSGAHDHRCPTKFDTARQLAAAIATLVVRQGDRVGTSVFDQRLRSFHRSAGSLTHLQQVVADLEATQPATGPADLGASLAQLHGALSSPYHGRQRGVIAILSDCLDDPQPMLRAIDRLRHAGSEVLIFQILSPDELNLESADESGLLVLDPERSGTTHDTAPLKTHPAQVAQRYRQLIDEHQRRLAREFASRDIDHTLVHTNRPLIEPLGRYLRLRTQRTRR